MKSWHWILLIGIAGVGGWWYWKRYKEQIALATVIQDPKGVAKLGLMNVVDSKVNEGISKGVDSIARMVGL